MFLVPFEDEGDCATPLYVVTEHGLPDFLADRPPAWREWLARSGFAGRPQQAVALPDAGGAPEVAFAGAGSPPDMWTLAGITLPRGNYRLAQPFPDRVCDGLMTGYCLGSYRFDRYLRRVPPQEVFLAWPPAADRDRVMTIAGAVCHVRDLINTPAEDMGPAEFSLAAAGTAAECGMDFREIVGDALREENFPLIHAVGRASERPPRLLSLEGGDPSWPRVTLVGKGICFDTGGLDIKGASGMALMRKDMAGAAIMLGLTRALRQSGIRIRLRTLLPVAENAVSGRAMRPGDVFRARNGLNVEIGNTDAEGRLVLADALALGCEEQPELVIDAATLTGAARTAAGPELPVFFSNDDALAAELEEAAGAAGEPLWRLPLWKPYRSFIDSRVADLNNSGDLQMAGAITAALFLQEFVTCPSWIHIDCFGWNLRPLPGRPAGGEATGLRALFGMLGRRYGTC